MCWPRAAKTASTDPHGVTKLLRRRRCQESTATEGKSPVFETYAASGRISLVAPGRPAGKQRQVTESGKAQVVLGRSPRPGSVNNGLTTRVTRKGYAVPGDRRHLPQGETSIKKDGGRRSVTGAERQSKAEPDEDGQALGGSAVHYKRTAISYGERQTRFDP
jgi:hypothetical protein